MLPINVSDPVLDALHILTHLAEVEDVVIIAIHKWGNQGQESLSNLLKVAARLSGSRVWALYHKPACSMGSQGMGLGQ